MKYNNIYKDINCNSCDDVFNFLIYNLVDSITTWDYFVNWNKVLKNIKEIEIELNTLNYIIGKNDIEAELKHLLRKQPNIIPVIPVLLACRDKDIQILIDYADGNLNYEKINFSRKSIFSDNDIEKIIFFMKNTGLLKILQNKTIKSLPDYFFGIEVGLDSNGRKNRSGTAMENIVENLLEKISLNNDFEYIKQATKEKIWNQWKIDLDVDKSNRRFDYAVFNKKKLFLMETNYYGGGGSKLKATAGEYKSLYDLLSKQNHKFIWITDGIGWKNTTRPLRETFNHIDYLFNLKMLSSGILEKILKENL